MLLLVHLTSVVNNFVLDNFQFYYFKISGQRYQDMLVIKLTFTTFFT